MQFTEPIRQSPYLLPGPLHVLPSGRPGSLAPELAQIAALGPRKHNVSFKALLVREYGLDKMIMS